MWCLVACDFYLGTQINHLVSISTFVTGVLCSHACHNGFKLDSNSHAASKLPNTGNAPIMAPAHQYLATLK
jgi:hypothetical protein